MVQPVFFLKLAEETVNLHCVPKAALWEPLVQHFLRVTEEGPPGLWRTDCFARKGLTVRRGWLLHLEKRGLVFFSASQEQVDVLPPHKMAILQMDDSAHPPLLYIGTHPDKLMGFHFLDPDGVKEQLSSFL